jgi:hypothetical protein|eukprot:COSAG06_NODE_10926_length_1594_cov_43.794649_2_plen_62_part_00
MNGLKQISSTCRDDSVPHRTKVPEIKRTKQPLLLKVRCGPGSDVRRLATGGVLAMGKLRCP